MIESGRIALTPGIDHYCVVGNPIAHSKSPQIHSAFARQTGQYLHYQAVLVLAGGFLPVLNEFRRQGGKGMNITLPFKQDAWQACTVRTPRAQRAGAVNTVWFPDATAIHGDNTDGIGLVRDLRDNLGRGLAGQRVLILGAGGAVRGVLDPLFDEQVAEIVIANRTLEKAAAIVQAFADRGPLRANGYEELAGTTFPIIINATSLSLQQALPPLPGGVLATGGLAYDMMYADEPTVFMRWALEQGAGQVADGLGMLVEQAAEAFTLWRGVRPETAPVIKSLRTPGT